MKRASQISLFAATVFAAGSAAAQLAAPANRTSDPVIHADHKTYEALQARLKALNDRGDAPVGSYAMSKAQCWLDVSFHEYTRNDRSPFPQLALEQSEILVKALESRAGASADTPLVNGAARLRLDLWQAAESLKSHAGYRCAAQLVACTEVELVHAGNEHNQQGWRHAKPYVQMAEDKLAEAAMAAERCTPPPPPVPVAVAPVPVPPPPPPPPPPVAEPVTFAARVLFKFDRADAAGIHAATRRDLDELIKQVTAPGARIDRVELIGHADRLKRAGVSDYNDKLALRRAQTVRDLLAAGGIDAASISVASRGDEEQLVPCQERHASAAQLRECLLDNRRVDVRVVGTRNRAP